MLYKCGNSLGGFGGGGGGSLVFLILGTFIPLVPVAYGDYNQLGTTHLV